jgi:hypothetical protein
LLAFIINSDGKGAFRFEVKGITISVGAFKLKILFWIIIHGLNQA